MPEKRGKRKKITPLQKNAPETIFFRMNIFGQNTIAAAAIAASPAAARAIMGLSKETKICKA